MNGELRLIGPRRFLPLRVLSTFYWSTFMTISLTKIVIFSMLGTVEVSGSEGVRMLWAWPEELWIAPILYG